MVSFDEYEPFQPGVAKPWHELSRPEARAVYQRVMEELPERIEQLRRLVATDGLTLGDDDRSVQQLNDWFRARVEADQDDPDELRPLWHAVSFDIAVFLGDIMVRRNPGLRWELFTHGKKQVGYHQPVIMGFTRAPLNFYVELDRGMITTAYRVVEGLPVDTDEFVALLEAASRRA